MTVQEIIMQKRTEAGLRLEFNVPDRASTFTCYPKDDAQKQKFLDNADAKGWTLVK